MKPILHFILITTLTLTATSCKKPIQPSEQVTTLGSIEVTARLEEIRGKLPDKPLYDYVYIMKYKVLKTHRGAVEGDSIYVAQYNPLKPRAAVADKFVKDVGGNVQSFRAGDLHRMAFNAPLDEFYMGGVVDPQFKDKGIRYFAIWTEKAE